MKTANLINHLEMIYLGLSARGWADEATEESHPSFPRAKIISLIDGPIRYTDAYLASDRFCQGMTWLAVDRGGKLTAFWQMLYRGWWDPAQEQRVIRVLRQALKRAYNAALFVGGRGVAELIDSGFIYTNHTSAGSDFTQFRGSESIWEHLGPRQHLEFYYEGGLMPGVNLEGLFPEGAVF